MPADKTRSESYPGVADGDPRVVSPSPGGSSAAEPRTGFNPLRYEADAFKVLLWFVGTIAALVVVVLIIEAIT